jgi:hypothetical protein
MRPIKHAIISAVSAGAVYTLTRSPELAALNFAAGVLIDLDHVIDFMIGSRGRWDFRMFWRARYHLLFPRLFFSFHSWEAAFLLALAGALAKNRPSLWAVGLGLLLHLLADTLVNPGTWKSYFIFYRARHGFRSAICFPDTGNQ